MKKCINLMKTIFVKGNDVEDIMLGAPRKQEAILAMYMLFLDDENGDLGMPS